MKDFAVYTALRLGLFVGAAALVFGAWSLVAESVPISWLVIVAFLVSGVASYFLLDRPRAALARRVEERAQRLSERLEEMRTKEDGPPA